MTSFIDTPEFSLYYLIIIILLTGFNILFFIARKQENSATKLKVIIIILFGFSLVLFITNSLPTLFNLNQSLKSSENVLISNISFFLLCISIGLFLFSLHCSDDDVISLEKPSFFKSRNGTIKLGRIMEETHNKHNFFLSIKDLEKHMFICGATGTGKTNFLQYFLINLAKRYNIPFLLVEFKGEYHFLQRKIKNLLIIRPGENFSLNIFNPEGSLPEIHAERVFDILKSGNFLNVQADFSPQMEKVLVEILSNVCRNKNLQSWKGFYDACREYAEENRPNIPMLSQTLISITNRIRRFSLGPLKAIFDTNHAIKPYDLFSWNVLIDLSSIIRLGGEKEDALFFLNMVLKYLWDKNLTHGAFNFQGIKHLTIVEDAQYFAPKNLTRQNKLTSYLEDIALLQRGTGECLISLATHPNISEDILANCGVLVCFKTHMEKEFLCKLLNLEIEHEDYLSILEEGQCLVRVNSIKRPFLLKVPLVKREWLELSEIKKNNKIILNNFKDLKGEQIMEKDKKFNKRIKNGIKKSKLKLNKRSISLESDEEYDILEVEGRENNDNLFPDKNDDVKNIRYFNEYDPLIYQDYPESEEEEESFKRLDLFIKKLYEEQEKKKNNVN